MRRVLLDAARHQLRVKRGGRQVQVSLDEVPLAAASSDVDTVDVLELDRALTELEALDPDQSRIVELRFFGGLTVEETAEVVGVSTATIKREWAIAKGWLYQTLRPTAE